MVVVCPVDCFAQTFDVLSMHGRTVDFTQFMEKIAGLADTVKFPEARCPPKPASAALYEKGGVWALADGRWLAAAARARRSLELKMAGLDPPRVFETVGTRDRGGGVKNRPVEEFLVDLHGHQSWSYRHLVLPVIRIKQHLDGFRPKTCFYCSKNYQELATEAYEAGYIADPWVELYLQFIQLDHTDGRPNNWLLPGLRGVCIPCHFVKTKFYPPFQKSHGFHYVAAD
jgi:hypothetical protein